jgi:hypothetical protein
LHWETGLCTQSSCVVVLSLGSRSSSVSVLTQQQEHSHQYHLYLPTVIATATVLIDVTNLGEHAMLEQLGQLREHTLHVPLDTISHDETRTIQEESEEGNNNNNNNNNNSSSLLLKCSGSTLSLLLYLGLWRAPNIGDASHLLLGLDPRMYWVIFVVYRFTSWLIVERTSSVAHSHRRPLVQTTDRLDRGSVSVKLDFEVY